MSHAAQTPHSLVIVGDFNIDMDIDTDADTIRMCDVLSMYDLVQHASVPTHRSGHTLDLTITRCNRELLSNPVADCMFSDHMFLRYRVNMHIPSVETLTISYWKLKQIDSSAFSTNHLKDLVNGLLSINYINQLVCEYNTELRLDRLAPIQTKTMVVKPLVPWFVDELKH